MVPIGPFPKSRDGRASSTPCLLLGSKSGRVQLGLLEARNFGERPLFRSALTIVGCIPTIALLEAARVHTCRC